ncbi:MAG: dihydropteroate synthase [Bacteroidetes bacterium]|nr:MAG: dihydropteroate synthase [Bacteroidota bacterium]
MAQKAGSPDKGTSFSETCMLQCGTKQLDLSGGVVMGILNITPDSFYDGGRYNSIKEILSYTENMMVAGAEIIDIGAVSSKPGALQLTADVEKKRLFPVLDAVLEAFPETIISVDTWRSDIARECCDMGVGIINDISGGQFDENMHTMIGNQQAAYVLMHIKGTPQTMQLNPVYADVVAEVGAFFEEQLRKPGLADKKNIILDPGFGFGKSVSDNYRILDNLNSFLNHGFPLLAGLSRKSMINRILNSSPADALNGTTVLNTIALLRGASILRVHDVKEALETIKLTKALKQSGLNP